MYDGLSFLLTTKSWITLPGIHNVGSYGTRGIIKAADGIYENQLGLIADYNRTGWSNGFGGDYVMTDAPIEGTGLVNIYSMDGSQKHLVFLSSHSIVMSIILMTTFTATL